MGAFGKRKLGRPAAIIRSIETFLISLAALVGGCGARPMHVPLDPRVDFAAHSEHRGLVVDRAEGGQPAVLVPASTLPFTSGPTYVLEGDGKTMAALWVKDAGHITIRQAADAAAPVLGRVQAHWHHGAISLTFTPVAGPELHTTEFQRTDGPVGPAVLGPQITTAPDIRGFYQADLLDSTGAPVGWLRVRLTPYMDASRVYDGVLPDSVQEPLATAAVELVDSDIDYIEGHATNVYLGN